MAVLSDYTSGTISLANGSTAVTGTGTLFDVAKFREGDTLQIENLTAVIASVDSNTSLTLTVPWTGTTLTNAPYRARYLSDGARVTAQATTLIELLGNGVLSNLAEIGVEDGKSPVGNAAGEYELVDTGTFGIQDPNGSLAKLAALTLASRQILQTDENGALKALALSADKFLRTDENGDLALSDLGAAAIALLNLSGTAAADRLPYLTGTSGAGLTVLTAFARSILDDISGASMFATMGFAAGPGWIKLPSGHIFQYGTTVGTVDSIGFLVVTLPTAYTSSTSYRFVAMNGDQDTLGVVSAVKASPWPSNDAFAVRFRSTPDNSIIQNQPRRVDWLAIGS